MSTTEKKLNNTLQLEHIYCPLLALVETRRLFGYISSNLAPKTGLYFANNRRKETTTFF